MASLAVQAVVIATSDLGPSPSPAEIEAWQAESRLGIAAVGALLMAGASFLIVFVRRLGPHLRGGRFVAAGTWLLGAGGVAMALYGAFAVVFAVVGVVNPPELIVSNLTDALVGAGLLVMGGVEWSRRTAPRPVGGLGLLLGASLLTLAWTPAADPHAAQVGLLIWLVARAGHLAWKARSRQDAALAASRE